MQNGWRKKQRVLAGIQDGLQIDFWVSINSLKINSISFSEANQIPDANVEDKDFQKYLDKKKMSISLADSTTSGFPRRSRKPESIEDIQHCVAYNVVM